MKASFIEKVQSLAVLTLASDLHVREVRDALKRGMLEEAGRKLALIEQANARMRDVLGVDERGEVVDGGRGGGVREVHTQDGEGGMPGDRGIT